MVDKPKTLQEVADEFHMLMGYCIAAWAHVDDEVYEIFRDCMASFEPSAIVYYRTPGLDVRVNMTDEVVRYILPKHEPAQQPHPHLKEWRAIRAEVSRLLPIRRRIAHQPTAFKREPLSKRLIEQDAQPQPWFEIYMSQNEKLRGREEKIPALLRDDLWNHLVDVNNLTTPLFKFRADVLAKTP